MMVAAFILYVQESFFCYSYSGRRRSRRSRIKHIQVIFKPALLRSLLLIDAGHSKRTIRREKKKRSPWFLSICVSIFMHICTINERKPQIIYCCQDFCASNGKTSHHSILILICSVGRCMMSNTFQWTDKKYFDHFHLEEKRSWDPIMAITMKLFEMPFIAFFIFIAIENQKLLL